MRMIIDIEANNLLGPALDYKVLPFRLKETFKVWCADLHEEDLMGSSSAYKSAACNLMFSRNKESEDDIERNTTVMKATKIRWTGKTGIAGKYYYDNDKHTLYDLDDWLKENGPDEF